MFAAGSFWTAEAAFRRVAGVQRTTVGYCGGHVRNPTYEQVAAGGTGHAEVVVVIYDSRRISYGRLLEVFWEIHDPTDDGGRGTGLGPHHRSVVFYFNKAQRRLAAKSLCRQQAATAHQNPIVTEILPASRFCAAEECHQRYLEKRGQMARSLFGG